MWDKAKPEFEIKQRMKLVKNSKLFFAKCIIGYIIIDTTQHHLLSNIKNQHINNPRLYAKPLNTIDFLNHHQIQTLINES